MGGCYGLTYYMDQPPWLVPLEFIKQYTVGLGEITWNMQNAHTESASEVFGSKIEF